MASLSSGIRRSQVWRSQGMLILYAMLLGVVAGLIFGERARIVEPIGEIFIRLLVAAAVPLVVANLLSGLTALDDVKGIGRIGGRFCVFFMLTTVLAIGLGIAVTTILAPGIGMSVPGASMSVATGQPPGVGDFLFNLFPDNVFAALAEGRVIQLIVFALMLGVAAMLAPPNIRLAFHKGASVLDIVLRELVTLIMRFAPIGIGALSAAAAGQFGPDMFGPLSLLVAGIWTAQAIFAATILLLLALIMRGSPLPFLRATGPVYATAAATCSSMASLAVALRIAEERMNWPRHIYSLTIPLGSQLSKEGTAVMAAAVLIFTAQVAGISFSWADYGTILLMTLLLSGASGGIPGGGLVKVLILVEAFNMPLEIAAIVGGIYRIVDITNTSVNMLGDMVGTQIVATLEGDDGERAQIQP